MWGLRKCFTPNSGFSINKANLRDLIAATGLVISLKLDTNRRLFSPRGLEIWLMTPKSSRAPLLYYVKFVHPFKSMGEFELEIQSGNTEFGRKLAIIFSMLPWNLMDDLGKQQGTYSILHQAFCIISKPSVNPNWSYSPETLNSSRNRRFFVPYDLEIWWMSLKNNRAPLLCYFKLCGSFCSHWSIQNRVTVRERPIAVKIDELF